MLRFEERGAVIRTGPGGWVIRNHSALTRITRVDN